MRVEYLIGMILGCLVGVLFVAIIFKFTKKDGSMKCKFDERQIIARGEAFKLGFFTLMIYDFLFGMFSIFSIKPIIDTFLGLTIGICIAVGVFVIYCVWHEAYFSLNESPKKVLVAFFLIAVFNLVIGGINIYNGSIMTNGMLNFRLSNLLCGIFFIMLFIAMAAKKIVNQKDVD